MKLETVATLLRPLLRMKGASSRGDANAAECPRPQPSAKSMDPAQPSPLQPATAALPGQADQRLTPDRRKEPTGPWDALPPAGKRVGHRRAGDRGRPYFVDRFSPVMLALVLMLAIASLVDAVLTVQLLQAGGKEINPLMDRLLGYGILPFVLGKYALTVGGLPLLLIFKNHYLFGTRLRVGYLIPLTVALYGVLIAYQLMLMRQYVVP